MMALSAKELEILGLSGFALFRPERSSPARYAGAPRPFSRELPPETRLLDRSRRSFTSLPSPSLPT